jgi:hypothetical protein
MTEDKSLCRKKNCTNKRHITKSGKLRTYCAVHENAASRRSKRKSKVSG